MRVIKNGALLPTPFVTLTVNASCERGLLGVTFDPNFATNNFVYVYYTATTPAIRLWTSTRSNRACSIIALRVAWSGCIRIDSAR